MGPGRFNASSSSGWPTRWPRRFFEDWIKPGDMALIDWDGYEFTLSPAHADAVAT